MSLTRIARAPFEWQGYHFAAGTTIIYSPYVSHRLPQYFPEPDCFRPERFDPVGGERYPPYAYIPFGGGPRSCLGAPFAMMELQTVLVMLVQRFRLDLVPGQRIDAVVRTTLQPKRGLRVRPQPQDGHSERSPARVLGSVTASMRSG